MGFLIREATDRDGGPLTALSGAVESEFGAHLPDGNHSDLAAVVSTYAGQGGAFWVLGSEGSVCGGIGFLPDRAGGAEIRRFFLAGGWRGLGLSRLLLEEAARAADTRELAPLWLAVPEHYLPSLARLRALGFNETLPGGGRRAEPGRIYLQL
jgi:GNAT superfamily N-acetyltransferase